MVRFSIYLRLPNLQPPSNELQQFMKMDNEFESRNIKLMIQCRLYKINTTKQKKVTLFIFCEVV